MGKHMASSTRDHTRTPKAKQRSMDLRSARAVKWLAVRAEYVEAHS